MASWLLAFMNTYNTHTHTVRPIKKFTFRSYGTVSLFNYVRTGTQASLHIYDT